MIARRACLWGLFPLVSFGSVSCSLGRVGQDDCASNADCRAAFGVGSVCMSDGLCASAAPTPRCERTFPEDLLTRPERHLDTIVFGNLVDRSLTTHRAREDSARLASVQVNEADGLGGRQLGFVFCTIEENATLDDLSQTEAAVEAAAFLTDQLGAPAILGPPGSGDVIAVFEATEPRETLLISPSATSPALTALEPEASDTEPGRLWRTAPPDSIQGRAIAADLFDRNVTDVAVIAQVGAYGDGLTEAFRDSFSGQVSVMTFSTDGERAEVITAVGTSPASEVLFISSATQDVIAFMNAAASIPGYDSKGIFLSDSAANQDLLDRATPTRFSQVRGSRPAPLDQTEDFVYGNFIASYQIEYEEDVRLFSFTAQSYDAAWLLFYGAAWADAQESSVDSSGIARGLRRVTGGDERIEVKASSWLDVVDRFGAGQRIDIEGASGALDFDPLTEEVTAPIQIWSIDESGPMPRIVEEVVVE